MLATVDTTTSTARRSAAAGSGKGRIGVADEMVILASAGASWLGASIAPPVCRPMSVALVGALLGLSGIRLAASRHPGRPGRRAAAIVVTLLIGSFLLAGHRGIAADDAYRPLDVGSLPSPVQVLGDPEPIGLVAWKVEVRLPDGQRVEAMAHGRPAAALSRLRVGETVAVDGRLRPVGDRPWLRTRHVVARASVSEVTVVGEPAAWRTVVEAVRHRIGAGADVLDERQRALYRGLVLGDDRFQPPGQVLRFRLSGLSHLLAVSGQNVAFVLAAIAPIIGWLGGRRRLAALLVVLVIFALITRLEPSVLRAVSTAGLSAWAAVTGRARSGLGVLASAVIGLVLIDPFLVDSVGFQLSVAASVGILTLSPLTIRRLSGPAWLVQPLATGLGAQIGVAPLLTHYFGAVSLVTVPANLAAGWAAALTMVWGMTVGPVAGLLPPPLSGLLQRPVVASLWWLEQVAAIGARAPDPRPSLGIVAGLILSAMVVRVMPARWPSGIVAVAAVLVAVLTVPQAPQVPGECGRSIVWYPAGSAVMASSVLVVGPAAGTDAVEACRRAGIRSVDLVVVEVGDRRAGRTVGALHEVIDAGTTLAPGQHTVIGARRTIESEVVTTAGGRLVIEPDASGRRLAARLRR